MASNKKARGPRASASAGRDQRANGEGSIYWDKSKQRWIGAAYDINGVRRKQSSLTRKEAEDFCHEQKRARTLGKTTFAANPKQSLRDFLISWFENRTFKSPETRRNYETAINKWIAPYIGKILVGNIRPATIEKLYQTLDAAEMSGGVLNVTHAVLSKAFKDAYRLGELPNNPMERVQKLTKKSIPSKHIPKGDSDRIYAEAMKSPSLHARIEIGMVCSLRPGEILGLKWSDLDLDLRRLNIERQSQRVKGLGLVLRPVKTGQARSIPLSDRQIEILTMHRYNQELQKSTWDADTYGNFIFPNSIGKQMDDKLDWKLWKRLLAAARVSTSYKRYQQRKTGLTNLSASGVDIPTVKEYSGHTQITTLANHYLSATSASMDRALSIQDNLRPNEETLERIALDKEFAEWASQMPHSSEHFNYEGANDVQE